MPAQLDTICLYAQLSGHGSQAKISTENKYAQFLTPCTIRNYLSGVKLLYLFKGADYPYTKDFVLSMTLRGVSRKAFYTPSRASPVMPGILLQLSHTCDFKGDPVSCTLFCAYLFSFFLMARLANSVVPKSQQSFDPTRNLTRSDVVDDKDGL